MRRADDPLRPVRNCELREIDRVAVINGAVIDAGEEMKMKLGAHPYVVYPPRAAEFRHDVPDNRMTTRS